MSYAFSHAKVLIVGDALLDRYWYGATLRTSPEAPVPVVNVQDFEDRAGGAGNVAINVNALGGQATVLGVVGHDSEGESLRQLLQQAGIADNLQVIEQEKTITKLRVLSQQQQLIRLDFEKPYRYFDEAALLADFRQLLDDFDVVVFSDYGKGTLTAISAMIALAKAAGKTILVDANGDDYERYRGIDTLVLNAREFFAVVGECSDDTTLEFRARELMQQLAIRSLLITRGAKGMSLVLTDNDMITMPAANKDVYDVTGASDTVIAVFALALAAGYETLVAMRLANTAAGIVVNKLGTSSASLSELLHELEERQDEAVAVKGVVTREQLSAVINQARRQGQRIVMANGCFDLLHAGHVAYLQAAKQEGDRLLVAVNDDASIQRLKGPERPILPVTARMEMLAALQWVDWVVAFAEDTPEPILREIQPDVLVKGGDYQIDQVVGADIVYGYGGIVKVLPHPFQQCSTSQTLQQIQGN